MDDTLEIPRPRTENIQEGDGHSSGDEDGGLDWTKLAKFGAAARPIIPKRGEKDFEPAPGGGSGLQLHVLDRSREAMFEALRADRTISSKTISCGIWYPLIGRVHVTTERGIHFSTMGHSTSRMARYDNSGDRSDPSFRHHKRLELLPEEALYLIERGALFCYKLVSVGPSSVDSSSDETSGAPMSVQQAFVEMIGREELTLERYQVYAYLKRLGFVLMRAEPPTSDYPAAPPTFIPTSRRKPATASVFALYSRLASKIFIITQPFHRFDWWKRFQLHEQKTTQDIFKALRFISCGHTVPLHPLPVDSEFPSKPSPYKVFFHVYKPCTSFRKTTPPAPDFHIVVVNSRTTAMPSLQELTALFDILPELTLPPPRRRGTPTPAKQSGNSQSSDVCSMTPTTALQEGHSQSWSYILGTFFRRLFAVFPLFCTVPFSQRAELRSTPPKPNPFLSLKMGKKTVVIAAVDAGNISFFRFGQGIFEEWPMV